MDKGTDAGNRCALAIARLPVAVAFNSCPTGRFNVRNWFKEGNAHPCRFLRKPSESARRGCAELVSQRAAALRGRPDWGAGAPGGTRARPRRLRALARRRPTSRALRAGRSMRSRRGPRLCRRRRLLRLALLQQRGRVNRERANRHQTKVCSQFLLVTYAGSHSLARLYRA